MRIEFGDIHLDDQAKFNLLTCVENNQISGGPMVSKFEQDWTDLFGYKSSVAVSNGTMAIWCALQYLYEFGAEIGDEVIVPALGFIATSNAVRASNFLPVFVDVEPDTMNIDVKQIEKVISPKTRAIIAVHTMGKPCDMQRIQQIASSYNLYIIEDCAEAHGAKYYDRVVGSIGHMGTFSYYIAHLVCCGEGGMVSSSHADHAIVRDVVKSVRSHGRKPDTLYFDHVRYGLNCKMNDLEAAVGLSQIPKFQQTFDTRRKNLAALKAGLRRLTSDVIFNIEETYEVCCPHAFSMILRDPALDCARLVEFLTEKSIHVKRNFGSIPTQHRAFRWAGYPRGSFPNAEYIGDNGIHMACHQYLTDSDVNYMIESILEYFKKYGSLS